MSGTAVRAANAERQTATRQGSGEERLITTRNRLPSRRSVVGALLVTVAAMGTYLAATVDTAAPATSFVVLNRPIEVGEAVSVDDVGLVAMTLSPALAARALTSTRGLDGAVALRALRDGDLLLRADVRPPHATAGTAPVGPVHELTLPVPEDRTPERLQPGDRVTLIAHDDRTATTTVAVEDAVVLAFVPSGEGFSSGGDNRLTLGLDDAGTVVRVAHLSFLDLTVVLTTRGMRDTYPATFAMEPATTAFEASP